MSQAAFGEVGDATMATEASGLGMVRLDLLKAASWPGELGTSSCCTGEDGLDQLSPLGSSLTFLKELLFILQRAKKGEADCT